MYIPALFIHSKHQFNMKKIPFSLDCFKRPTVICDLFLKVPLKGTNDSLDCTKISITKKQRQLLLFWKNAISFWQVPSISPDVRLYPCRHTHSTKPIESLHVVVSGSQWFNTASEHGFLSASESYRKAFLLKQYKRIHGNATMLWKQGRNTIRIHWLTDLLLKCVCYVSLFFNAFNTTILRF